MMEICYINGKPYPKKDIENTSWQEYIRFSLSVMPRKLYKFFPNTISKSSGTNHSLEALKNNTVFLQSPILFDDPYDSTLYADEQEFHVIRVKYYATLCGFHYEDSWDISRIVYEFLVFLYPFLKSQSELEKVFQIKGNPNDLVDLTHQVFVLTLLNEIIRNPDSPTAFQDAFYQALHNEYISKQTDLIKKFRISCFTTNPFSMLMWAHYADSHKGFCVEYDIPTPDEHNINLLQNLLPVIYSDERVSVLNECLADLTCPTVTEETMSAIYKYGLLTKSVDWCYQNEWRLISLGDMLSEGNGFDCSFFPISKVFIGAKMSEDNRTEIIKNCNDQKIPSICVLPAPSVFSMEECPSKMNNPNCTYKKLVD